MGLPLLFHMPCAMDTRRPIPNASAAFHARPFIAAKSIATVAQNQDASNIMLAFAMLSSMSEVIVEVKNLRKEFDGTVAVADVSFEVQRGEIVGVLGANGAGKTTTIQILLGLVTPSSGTVRIFGKDLERDRVEILQRANFSSAYTNLPYNLRVWENLVIFSKLYGVRDGREKIDQLLELFEIAHLRNQSSGNLSSGETTRLNLCKALLNDPELLLLDEPTASLDPDFADKVRKLLRRIQREKQITMIYTSHNMRDVEEVCDRVLFLHKGRIIAKGTPQQLVERFNQKSLEEVFIRVARSGDVLEEEREERKASER